MEHISTEDYIKDHRNKVQQWVQRIMKILEDRAKKHDLSKLNDELELWKKLDEYPRYKYGSSEYFEKLKRFKNVFYTHWAHNRHHYEYFRIKHHGNISKIYTDIDLVDLIEMMCDWLSYNETITVTDAKKLVAEQMKRLGMPKEIAALILNTIINHFVTEKDNEEISE